MKIICPYCKADMPPVVLNKDKVECPYCMETFRISKLAPQFIEKEDESDMVRDHYPVEVETGDITPVATREIHPDSALLADPPGSAIVVERVTNRQAHIVIKKTTWAMGCFFLFFATFWNTIVAAVGGGMLFGEMPGGVSIFLLLFLVPFVLVGIATALIALFCLFGRTHLFLQPDECRLRYSLWGMGFNRRIPTADIEQVGKSESYRSNNRPVYGVSLIGANKKLTFGSALSGKEQQWLIEALRKVLGVESTAA